MKAAIALDDWKLPIFERRLSEAGYVYKMGPGIVPNTLCMYVETENALALTAVVKAANDEARRTGKP